MMRPTQVLSEVEPDPSTGYRQQMLHEADHAREDHQLAMGQQLRRFAEVSQHLALEPLGGQY
jgi:hypothetical protein